MEKLFAGVIMLSLPVSIFFKGLARVEVEVVPARDEGSVAVDDFTVFDSSDLPLGFSSCVLIFFNGIASEVEEGD